MRGITGPGTTLPDDSAGSIRKMDHGAGKVMRRCKFDSSVPVALLSLCLLAAFSPAGPAQGQAPAPSSAAAGEVISVPAPPDLREEIQQRGRDGMLRPDQVESVLRRADRLEAAGLPSHPVLDRVLQGIAKGVPFQRIEGVADELEVRLAMAARHVDGVFGSVPPSERAARSVLIDHGAYVLSEGVPGKAVEEVLKLAKDASLGPGEGSAGVLALGSLVGVGLKPEVSLNFVRTAWIKGYRGADLEMLGTELASLGKEGQGPPPGVVDRVLGMVRQDMEHERVFRDLDAMRGADHPGPIAPPGTQPGEDPGHQRGPGGPPLDPGHQGSGGHHPPPPGDGHPH
jgi:hypothetical protein